MARAVLCPVCQGKGVIYGPAPLGTAFDTQCHGCAGKGWVEIVDAQELSWMPLNQCPACGRDRSAASLTGCPSGNHYGTF